MEYLKNKYVKYGGGGFLILILAFWIFGGSDNDEKLSFEVQKDTFIHEIPATGELLAAKSERIMGPMEGMKFIGIWRTSITDIIDEGSKVDSGDYIATLDRDAVATKMKENEIEVQKAQSVYTQTKLDTSLKLREARNELVNLKFAMDEAKIIVGESEYEPPATIRKNEIAFEQAKLKYEQAMKNFVIKERQFEAKMQEAQATFDQVIKRQERMAEIMDEFIIRAKKSGVLIYTRNWDGKKVAVGSQIQAWNCVVAELPNLSQMNSRTYVNEVDIGKVAKGQSVDIGLDGIPDKKLTGTVDYVATIGEQLSNTGAKVFEVMIKVNESDSTLLPGMSTSNRILINEIEDVVLIPIECVFTEDSVSYVFVKGIYSDEKRSIKLGPSNMNMIVVEEGLSEGEEVLYNMPIQNEES